MKFKKILAFIQASITVASLSCLGASAENKSTDIKETEGVVPKVSIIVPVYNMEKYLDKCIDSITNQTLKEIEIICVNDGSKDGSLDILKEHQKNDPRIKIIDKKNAGVSAARNDGITVATGEYIEFVDSDDYIDKETCEISYECAKKSDADIICFGWRNFTDDGKGTFRKDCALDKRIFTDWKQAKKHRTSILCWNKLYRASMLKPNDLQFNPHIKIAEDECFNLCTYPFAKKIVHIPFTFYNYRVNLNSATKTMSFKFMITNYLKVWKYIDSFYESHNIKFNIFRRIFYLKIYKEDFLPILLPALKNQIS